MPKAVDFLDPRRRSPLDPIGLWGDPRTKRSLILDLETTGLLAGFGRQQSQVGISQVALREAGKQGVWWDRFTNILAEPARKYASGQIDIAEYEQLIESGGPTGGRWQKGWKHKGNVLYGVHEALVKATKAAADPTLKHNIHPLISEREVVERMTDWLKAGHEFKGWNIHYDMTVLGNLASDMGPAVRDKWARQVNLARDQGRIIEMSRGTKEFFFMAAQENAMRQKIGGDIAVLPNLANVRKGLVDAVKRGKYSAKDIERMTWDKMMEPHLGFQDMFQNWMKAYGKNPAPAEEYFKFLERMNLLGSKAQSFATGQIVPNIEFTKIWGADILAETLQPGVLKGGISGTTLEAQALKYASLGRLDTHEALSDTVIEELYEKLFRVKAHPDGRKLATFAEYWEQIAPRMKPFGIENLDTFLQRHKVAQTHVARSQLLDHVKESIHEVDYRHVTSTLRDKIGISKAAAKPVADALATQPETLRKLYSRAATDLSGKWRMFGKTHPVIAGAAMFLAGVSIVDALMPEKRHFQGVRDPVFNEYQNQPGMQFGPLGQSQARALTDFGSGRSLANVVTGEIALIKSSKGMSRAMQVAVTGQTERSIGIWTRARAAGEKKAITPSTGYQEYLDTQYRTRAFEGVAEQAGFKAKMSRWEVQSESADALLPAPSKRVRISSAFQMPEPKYGESFPTADLVRGRAVMVTDDALIQDIQSYRLVHDPSGMPSDGTIFKAFEGYARDRRLLSSMRRSKVRSVERQIVDEAKAKMAAWPDRLRSGLRLDAEQAGFDQVIRTQVEHSKRAQSTMRLWPQSLSGMGGRLPPLLPPGDFQLGTARRSITLGIENQLVKEIGFKPGLRDSYTPWNVAGYGIRPSAMRFGNVSVFSSGRPKGSLDIGAPGMPIASAPLANMRRLTKISGELSELPRVLEPVAATRERLFGRIAGIAEDVPLRGAPVLEGSKLIWPGWKGAPPDPIAKFVNEASSGLRGSVKSDILNIEKFFGAGTASQVKEMVDLGAQLKASGHGDQIYDLISGGRSGKGEGLSKANKAIAVENKVIEMRQDALAQRQAAITTEAATGKVSASATERAIQPITTTAAVESQARAVTDPRRLLANPYRKPLPQPMRVIGPSPDGPFLLPGPKHGPKPMPPAVKPLEQAIKEGAGKAVSMSPGMAAAGRVGFSILKTGGLILGASWLVQKFRERKYANQMANGPAYRHPGEFQAMGSYGEFVSSYEEYSWYEFQNPNPPSQLSSFGYGIEALSFLAWNQLSRGHQSPLERAWNKFLAGDVGIREVKAAQKKPGQLWPKNRGRFEYKEPRQFTKKIVKNLYKQGYTSAEVKRWFDFYGKPKLSPKISTKLAGDTVSDGWFNSRFDGIKGVFTKMAGGLGFKDLNRHGTSFSAKAKAWYENMVIRPFGEARGISNLDLNKYHKLKSTGALRLLKRSRHAVRYREELSAFKYLWKNTVSTQTTFTGKLAGVYNLFSHSGAPMVGAGHWGSMKVMHEMGVLNQSTTAGKMFAKAVVEPPSAAKKVADWADSLLKEKGWEGIQGSAAHRGVKAISAVSSRVASSGAYNVLRRIPKFQTVAGIARGFTTAEQYASSTKGLIVESAAGIVENLISWAFFSPKLWIGIGAAIGSILPGAGTAVGALIGTAVGTVAAAIGSVLVGSALGAAAGEVVRGVGATILGAKKKQMQAGPDTNGSYLAPEEVFSTGPGGGFSVMRDGGQGNWARGRAMDADRPDLSPFSSPYNSLHGDLIAMKTIIQSNAGRRLISEPKKLLTSGKGFTPTAGLVNNVLWGRRSRCNIRDVVQRNGNKRRRVPADRNPSRMMNRAA